MAWQARTPVTPPARLLLPVDFRSTSLRSARISGCDAGPAGVDPFRPEPTKRAARRADHTPQRIQTAWRGRVERRSLLKLSQRNLDVYSLLRFQMDLPGVSAQRSLHGWIEDLKRRRGREGVNDVAARSHRSDAEGAVGAGFRNSEELEAGLILLGYQEYSRLRKWGISTQPHLSLNSRPVECDYCLQSRGTLAHDNFGAWKWLPTGAERLEIGAWREATHLEPISCGRHTLRGELPICGDSPLRSRPPFRRCNRRETRYPLCTVDSVGRILQNKLPRGNLL